MAMKQDNNSVPARQRTAEALFLYCMPK